MKLVDLSFAYRYIPRDHSASHYAPFDHASYNTFIPQASRDSALTSFAQLGTLRLGTERAFISLFDRTHQHIIAEGTPSLSLIGGNTQDDQDRLRLGSCVLPKERGFCHHVEGLPSEQYNEHNEVVRSDSLVVNDVSKDERFRSPKLLEALSDVCFYAAVPIVSPRGCTIGAYSVMDRKPRTEPLDQNLLQFMKDMAATVMEHLALEHSTRKNNQAERMIVGLGSFVEGRSTLRDSWREASAQYAASEQSGETTEGQLNIQQQDLQRLSKDTTECNHTASKPTGRPSNDTRSRSNNRPPEAQQAQQPETEASNEKVHAVRSVLAGDQLHDDTLANSVKLIFSRAANLIRESIRAEGVLFLDANSERFGSLVKQNSRKISGPISKDPTSSSDESTDSTGSSKRSFSDGETDSTHVCECLGVSSSRMSSINDKTTAGSAIVVPEPLFTSLIRRYPRGKIFTYNANGSVSENSDSSQNPPSQLESGARGTGSGTDDQRTTSKKRRKPTFQKDADDLIKIFAGARNILLLPIWDSDKSRWYAGTLVWTKNPEHTFTFENELVYISAFANSIMAEIRRVDVELAEKAKTNLVSSITHELRNPLHGILGTADILSDTAMNALQHGMVHTIESCGRTLLDTINNLLDLTFIDKYQNRQPRRKSRRGKKSTAGSAQSKDVDRVRTKDRGDNLSYTHVQLDAILEEVAECVFAGYSFYTHPQAPPPALTDSSSRWGGPTKKDDQVGPRASQVTIIFDIQPDTEWDFNTHAGAWRRILMNVFGNALKYTPSGYIYLGLSSVPRDSGSSKELSEKQEQEFDVILTVRDTGKGISPQYLQDGLFTPFSQENPLASGSGLGLSIVRQAVGFLGGSIEIESTQGVGTTLTIRTPLTRSSDESDAASSSSMFSALQSHTQEKTIGFLGFGSSLRSQRDTSLYSSLERLCRDWFGLEATNLSPKEGENERYDFYLAVQTELDCEDTQGRDLFGLSQHLVNRDGSSAPVVVICQSPEEAHRMFVAAKNHDERSDFEFISQPCGPRKLARALDICIKRQLDQTSGRLSTDVPTRWVEMPQSSHIDVDVAASDAPKERLKISKRPTADTMGSPERESGRATPHERTLEERPRPSSQDAMPSISPKEINNDSEPCVLLVDDNELNLQLLCAYTKKDNHPYTTARNGAEAVELYKAHPGKFRIVIIGMSKPRRLKFPLPSVFPLLVPHLPGNANEIRYLNACYERLQSLPGNSPVGEGAPSGHDEICAANDAKNIDRRLNWT
jgi:signal transduction histidine kinase